MGVIVSVLNNIGQSLKGLILNEIKQMSGAKLPT
jgi:hypothetical protein